MTERGIKDREGEWEEKGGWEKQRETPDIDSRFGGGGVEAPANGFVYRLLHGAPHGSVKLQIILCFVARVGT